MPKVTQRQADLAVFILQFAATLFVLVSSILNRMDIYVISFALTASLIYGGLLLAYWRGWNPARPVAIVLVTILIAFALPEPFVTQYAPFVILVPPALALVLGGPLWVIGSASALIVILIFRASGRGVYAAPETLTLFVMVIGALVLSRLVSEANQREAEIKTNEARRQTRALAQKEEALRLNEERFRSLIENTSDGIVVINSKEQIIYRSPSMERMSGFKNSERLGHFGAERVHPDDIEAFMAVFVSVKQEPGAVKLFEYRTQHKSGEWHWVEVVLNNQLHEPSVQGVIINIRNITQRKQAEAELAARNDEIRSMSQQLWQTGKLATMGELAASLAHELNNPLATVSLRIESLLAQTPEDSPNHRPLVIVAQEAERMSKLVRNLLQFSHPGPQQMAWVNVREEIANSLELIEYQFKKHQITIIEDYSAEPPAVIADRQQLRQLFLNFFTNAVDAMPQGGTLTIRAQTQAATQTVLLEIADTGQGIQPKDLPRAFEPFFTTKPEGQGTGLGLVICRRIVQAHQGTLEITSPGIPGQGTTVRVTLPAATADDVASAAPLKP